MTTLTQAQQEELYRHSPKGSFQQAEDQRATRGLLQKGLLQEVDEKYILTNEGRRYRASKSICWTCCYLNDDTCELDLPLHQQKCRGRIPYYKNQKLTQSLKTELVRYEFWYPTIPNDMRAANALVRKGMLERHRSGKYGITDAGQKYKRQMEDRD
jgi:predicted transcriptional regulator